MSFDPKSLERLRELGRKLPQQLPIPGTSSNLNKTPKSKLHSIETEENPQKLFKELIKASSDGQIPSHLISRLKELEAKRQENDNSAEKPISNHSKISKSKPSTEEESLYISFKQLLLEED